MKDKEDSTDWMESKKPGLWGLIGVAFLLYCVGTVIYLIIADIYEATGLGVE